MRIFNGERNWRRKEYNDNGKIIFEGEYFNCQRWNGKGKEYNKKSQLIFEGYISKEKKGKEYNNNNDEIKFIFKWNKINKKEYKIRIFK